MAMALFQSSIFPRGSEVFLEPDFCQTIDSMIEYLKVTGNITYREIPKEFLGNYYGDFYAVLNGFNIDPQYHRIILLVNNYTSPYQYHGEEFLVKIPDIGIINSLLQVYSTGKSKWVGIVGQ